MDARNRIIISPFTSVILGILSVQGGAAIAKGLFPVVGAGVAASLRIVISAVILVAVFRPRIHKLSSAQWKAVVPYGLALGAMNIIFYEALERIPLGLAVTLEFVGPLLLAVVNSRRALDFVWVVLAATGIVLLSPWTGSVNDKWGIALALLAGALWAAYIVLGGRLSQQMRSGEAVAVGMIFAGIVVLPFSFYGGWSMATGSVLVQGALVAILSSILPFTLELSALRRMSARSFSILMSIEPAVAALCGLIFLGERLELTEWIAIVFIASASAGVALTARVEARKEMI